VSTWIEDWMLHGRRLGVPRNSQYGG